jgi:hypothetical protein
VIGDFYPRLIRVKEVNMWNEECDIIDAFEEHDLECEFVEDFSDLDLGSDMTEDEQEELFDEDDPCADEQD